jgi:hypothetical protein
VSAGNLTNATAGGFNTVVNASNKIRLGNTFVTVIEGQVAFTPFGQDQEGKTLAGGWRKPVLLGKIRGFELSSWNFISRSKEFRHYGPMAQDFFAARPATVSVRSARRLRVRSGDWRGFL